VERSAVPCFEIRLRAEGRQVNRKRGRRLMRLILWIEVAPMHELQALSSLSRLVFFIIRSIYHDGTASAST
jgi:hypothetical protein